MRRRACPRIADPSEAGRGGAGAEKQGKGRDEADERAEKPAEPKGKGRPEPDEAEGENRPEAGREPKGEKKEASGGLAHPKAKWMNPGDRPVDPDKAGKLLESHGWKLTKPSSSGVTDTYTHPDRPGESIGLGHDGAWAHNKFKDGDVGNLKGDNHRYVATFKR